jgi:hypothetical protein
MNPVRLGYLNQSRLVILENLRRPAILPILVNPVNLSPVRLAHQRSPAIQRYPANLSFLEIPWCPAIQ